MQVFQFVEAADKYSVPFDWDKDDDNIDYISHIVESYFDTKRRVGANWQPSFFGVVNKKQKVGDLGTLIGGEQIVFSQKAVDILMPLIKDSVELLPYPTEIGTYYLINVLDEGPYLDRQKTNCDEVLPNGNCFSINKYVFVESMLVGKHILRIPDDAVTRYISGDFIEACRENNLQGIELDDKVKVWDSEE